MAHKFTHRRAAALAVAALALAGAAGCAGWRDVSPMSLAKKVDIPSGVPWAKEKTPSGVPVRIVASWTDAVRHQPGKPAERGFGGRLYFYEKDPTTPIRVKGTLVVYAFDETDRTPTDNKPTRRYVFPSETFATHESESEFGVSYSVWLPWDEVGGPQTDVSLIARFDPTDGATMAVSDQARQRLPGELGPGFEKELLAMKSRASGGSEAANAAASVVEQAGFEAPVDPVRRRGIETTTISLAGSRVAERLSRAPVKQGSSVTYQSRGDSIRTARGLRPHGTRPASPQAPGALAAPQQAAR